MRQLESSDQIDEAADQEMAVLFKHSSVCPVSSSAFEELTRVEASFGQLPFYLIRVIEDKELSRQVAERWDIPHQSPQLILLKEGEAIWHTSHFRVTAHALRCQLDSLSFKQDRSSTEE